LKNLIKYKEKLLLWWQNAVCSMIGFVAIDLYLK
jgi:hypothetical protein